MKKTILFLIFACILVSCRNTVKEYYDTGELKHKYQTKSGLNDGYYKEYFKSGKLNVEVNFIKGKAEGIKKVYYENGNLEMEVLYVDGKKNGLQTGYFENGVLEYKGYCKGDKQHGLTTYYYHNGKIESTCEYKDDLRDGEAKGYSKDGKLTYYFVYEKDSTYFYEKYDEKGKLTDYFRGIIFTPLKDSIVYLGDRMESKIKLYGPIEGRNIKVFRYILNKNKKLLFKESVKFKKGENQKSVSFAPQETFYIYYELMDFLDESVGMGYGNTEMTKVTVIKRKNK
jgi:antitoxin component YwqK of YwqJK toxin-antitoxin module